MVIPVACLHWGARRALTIPSLLYDDLPLSLCALRNCGNNISQWIHTCFDRRHDVGSYSGQLFIKIDTVKRTADVPPTRGRVSRFSRLLGGRYAWAVFLTLSIQFLDKGYANLSGVDLKQLNYDIKNGNNYPPKFCSQKRSQLLLPEHWLALKKASDDAGLFCYFFDFYEPKTNFAVKGAKK